MPIDFRTHKKHSSSLSNEIASLISDFKNERHAKYSFWKDAVSEQIAKVTEPVFIKRGILYVKVTNSVWRFEVLTQRKEEILEKINSIITKNKIKDIVFI